MIGLVAVLWTLVAIGLGLALAWVDAEPRPGELDDRLIRAIEIGQIGAIPHEPSAAELRRRAA